MTTPADRTRETLFGRTPWQTTKGLAEALRTETVGGALLLAAAAIALVWANSPAGDSYRSMLEFTVGPESLHLDLDLRHWAADGLLAIFFFVAGIELKQELVVGELRDPRRAALPVVAAVCGVAVPTLIFLAITAGDPAARSGWAIPAATDIAFALAVLAVLGSHLPRAMRSFLLTLAVVDDVIAITIIALFYTDDLSWLPLAGSALAIAAFGLAARYRIGEVWLKLPLALTAWATMHASGVHATVAGVLLALTMPVIARAGESEPPADRVEHLLRPVSAGFAVPVFALCAAGVQLSGGVGDTLTDPVTLGIIAGLVLGKPIGVLGGTWLTARFTRARLDDGLSWVDVLGLSLLAGIGFTVSLLIGELAFPLGSALGEHARLAVLLASAIAAVLAAVVLVPRNAVLRRIEEADLALDAVPDPAPDAAPDPAGGTLAGRREAGGDGRSDSQ